jgi:predicted RNA-binding Zn ribbon-like protein
MPLIARRSLDDLLAVTNTLHGRDGHSPLLIAHDLAPGETHDHLDDAAMTVTFLREHGVAVPPGRPTSAQRRALRALRDALRALATGRRREYERYAAAMLAHWRFRATPRGELQADGAGWDGFVADLALALLVARDLGDRLKRCANRDCGWIYVDASKNVSRQWCERRTCGNRANLRRWRARRRRAASAS